MKRFFLLALVLLFAVGCATSKPKYLPPSMTPVVEPLPDCMEGYNRSMDKFNEGLFYGVFLPVARTWNFIVPESPRIWISNFYTNVVNYPVDAVTLLLGGEFSNAWYATKRLGINLSLGFLGFKDAATERGMLPVYGGFNRTFASWGIGDGGTVVLPVLGTHSARSATGSVLDLIAMPLQSLIGMPGAIAVGATDVVNKASLQEAKLYQFFETEGHPYEVQKLYGYYKERVRATRYQYDQKSPAWNCDDTLGYIKFAPQDSELVHAAKNNTVAVTGIGKFTYSCWPVKKSTKVVIVLPGLGSHRLSQSVIAWAELLNKEGCSVIALSSTMTPDFIQGQKADHPIGYLPEDAALLKRILPIVVSDFQKRYADGVKMDCRILGYSLGGLNALHLAVNETKSPLEISRYVAINPPVDGFDALQKADQYFNLPQSWGQNEKQQAARVQDVIMRVVAAANPNNLNPPPKAFPLTREESLFLLGLNLRANLASYIQTQQQSPAAERVLKEDPCSGLHKNALMDETLAFSFQDYAEKILLPWYQKRSMPKATRQQMIEACSLRSLTAQLKNNKRIRVFQNENDPILQAKDRSWYKETFGENTYLFPRGGHLGNMANPDYQKAVLNALLK